VCGVGLGCFIWCGDVVVEVCVVLVVGFVWVDFVCCVCEYWVDDDVRVFG